jgi:hypothetical protein
MPFVIFAAYPTLVLLTGPLRRRRRRQRGCCLHCGYCLIGNTSGTCPECGAVVTEPATRDPGPRRAIWRAATVLACLAIPVALMGGRTRELHACRDCTHAELNVDYVLRIPFTEINVLKIPGRTIRGDDGFVAKLLDPQESCEHDWRRQDREFISPVFGKAGNYIPDYPRLVGEECDDPAYKDFLVTEGIVLPKHFRESVDDRMLSGDLDWIRSLYFEWKKDGDRVFDVVY